MGLKRKEIRDEKGHKGRKESGASGRAGRGQSRPGRAAVGTSTGAGDTELVHEAVVLALLLKRGREAQIRDGKKRDNRMGREERKRQVAREARKATVGRKRK